MRRSTRLTVKEGVIVKESKYFNKKEQKEEDEEGGKRKIKQEDFGADEEAKIIKERKVKHEGGEEVVQEEAKVNKEKRKQTKSKQKVNLKASPYPSFSHPSPEECRRVCKALSRLHGFPSRPPVMEGEVPNVIQSIIRTILSQNTTQENGSRAYKSMTSKFGSLNWEAILKAPPQELEESIACGGIGKKKAEFIQEMLGKVLAKYGKLSLDHFYQHNISDEEVLQELTSYKGVGLKSAACVGMFCLRRETFPVDTHILRISQKILGWVPAAADLDKAFLHLNIRIPSDLKYTLHNLIMRHGQSCESCAANGKPRKKGAIIKAADCPLRKTIKALNNSRKSSAENVENAEKTGNAENTEIAENIQKESKEIESDIEAVYVVEEFSLEVEGTGRYA